MARLRGRAGYTLVEMLVALVMFAFISVAAAFALEVALRSQTTTHSRSEEVLEARATLNMITRDLRCAYASAGNPTTLFVGSGNFAGILMQFTTLTGRLRDDTPTTGTLGASEDVWKPQSDVAMVSYSFDPDTMTLSRSVTNLPNAETLPQSDTPETVLSRQVRSIQITFAGADGQGRTDWDYRTPSALPQGAAAGGTGGTGGTGQASGATTTQEGGSDQALPTSVEVALEMVAPDGRVARYTATVAIESPTPQPAGQKPATTTAAPAPQPGVGGTGARSWAVPSLPRGILPGLSGVGPTTAEGRQ